MKRVIFCIAILFFIAESCKKTSPFDSPTLPPITQEGKNTFGCKINGKVWVPYLKCDFFVDPCGEMQIEYINPVGSNFNLPFSFNLLARRSKGNDYSSFIFGNHFTAIHNTGNQFDSLVISCTQGVRRYYSYGFQNQIKDIKSDFTITKLDTINKIMAGTFNLVLRDYPDSVVITDGRFDFSLNGYCHCTP